MDSRGLVTGSGFQPMLTVIPERQPKSAEEIRQFMDNLSTPDAQFEVVLGQARLLTVRRDLAVAGKPSPVLAIGDPSIVALEVMPNPRLLRADAHWRLAVLHSQQGDFTSVTECFQKALQQQPRNPDIYCDWGYCQYSQNRWQEAEQSLRQAIALAPQHGRVHNNLALLLARTNRVQEALAEFAAAGRSPAEAYENVAFALTLEQRLSEAQYFCQTALSCDPTSKTANKLNSTLSARLNATPGGNPTPGSESSLAGVGGGHSGTVQPTGYCFPGPR